MALSDILNRIASDAAHEAKEIVDAAQAEADEMVVNASEQASDAARRFERERVGEAVRDAETILAGARLRARDADVAARGELVRRALGALEERIVRLPDVAYTTFIARAIVDAAAGAETVKVAAADAALLAGLKAAVDSLSAERGRDLGLRFASGPADVAHGVVLVGDRSANDLSVAGLVESRRETLVMRLAASLFDEADDGA